MVEGQRFEAYVRFISNVPHTKHERGEVPCHSLNKQQQGWHEANMTTKETWTIGWKHEIRSHIMCGKSLKTISQIKKKTPSKHYIWNKSFKF
jgi:hypothetical protein